MELWIIWLIATAVLLIIELLSNVVATLCMAVGCFIASILALLGFGIVAQVIGLVAGVILAFIFIAPLVNRLHASRHRDREAYNSNMNALIGRIAEVTKPFTGESEPGRARIDGDNWQIRSADGAPLARGMQVKVVGYDSIILLVRPC